MLLLGVEGPNGEVASLDELRGSPGTRVTRTSRVGHLALSLPMRGPSGAEWGPGTWTLLIGGGGNAIDVKARQSLAVLMHKSLLSAAIQGPVSYAALVNARTALRLRADMFARPGR